MVDGAPEIAELAIDLHKDLIQMPAPLRIAARMRDASLADLGGEHWAKPVPPEPDGLMTDVNPALGQQILDVARRQRISHVHHHDQTDNLRRTVEISERVAHGMKLPRPRHPRIWSDTALATTKTKAPAFAAQIHRRIAKIVSNIRLQGDHLCALYVPTNAA